MRGTLSLRTPESGFSFKHIYLYRSVSSIIIDKNETYLLIKEEHLFKNKSQYILCDTEHNILQNWQFDISWSAQSLLLKATPQLRYILKNNEAFGNFVTDHDQIPATMQLMGKSRQLKIEKMDFKHKDFESVVHFRCQNEDLYVAILIADILFNAQHQQNNE